MTLVEFLENLAIDCDEDLSDTEITRRFKNYINRGYKELARREKLERSSIKTVNDNKYITVPDDLIEISEIRQNGDKVSYRVDANKIYINVSPNSDITLSYVYIPDVLKKDKDSTETLLANDEFILNYAKWLYYLNDGLLEEAQIYKSEYENMMINRNNIKSETLINIWEGAI